jgi:hypothetical protein
MPDAVTPTAQRTQAAEYARVLVPALLVVGAAVLLHSYAPTALHLPSCPFHDITGLYCPGCGSTRALHHLLNLDLITALRCNALAVIAAPFLLAHFSLDGLRKLNLWRGPQFTLSVKAGWALTALVLAWTVARNLPFAVFTIPPQ